MKRLQTVNQVEKLKEVEYKLPETVKSPYLVDDSNFIPMSEAVKQLSVNSHPSTSDKAYYDYPDGVDKGDKVPYYRTKDCVGLAELSNSVNEQIADIKDRVEANMTFERIKKDFKDKMNSINSGNNGNGDNSSTPQK